MRTIGNVTFNDGAITVAGRPVGRADHELKHGYHPVVRLRIDGAEPVEFEIDTPSLVEQLFNEVYRLVPSALLETQFLFSEAAKAAYEGTSSEIVSDAGYYWPSVEFFVDDYLQNTVGFNSSYPDPAVVVKWTTEGLTLAADYIGDDATLYMQALVDSLNQYSHEEFIAWCEKHGEENWLGIGEEIELARFNQVCAMVREYLGVQA